MVYTFEDINCSKYFQNNVANVTCPWHVVTMTTPKIQWRKGCVIKLDLLNISTHKNHTFCV